MNNNKSNRVNRIGFLYHPTKPEALALLTKLLEWISNYNLKCHSKLQVFLDEQIIKKLNNYNYDFIDFVKRVEIAKQSEIIIVLGGDGTVLDAVKLTLQYNTPIVGINLGHIGFLTAAEAQHATKIVERVINGKFIVENRSVIQAKVIRSGKTTFESFALNDVVITKGPSLRIITLEISISGTKIMKIRGDGVIFSTPTGSTAYSLSAGGPIVPPWVGVIIVTPLNSHTLSTRPVVASDNELFCAQLSCSHSEVFLVLDGHEDFRLLDGDKIIVSRSKFFAKIVTFKTRNFFQILKKKLKWNSM